MTMPRTRLSSQLAAPLVQLALLFLWLAAAAVPAGAAVAIQDVKSPKGVEAWLVEDYSVPIVTIRFAFAGGSAQNPAGKEGLANLMSGLFDEGAGDLDSDAFQEKLDDAGAEMSFDSTRDRIYGSMRMLASEKDAAFELLRLAVNSPRFDQAPVDRIRAQIVSGIVASERDPETAGGIALAKALYGDHPYSRRDEGTPESLAAVTVEDLKAFHGRMFARDNLKIAVVGAIDRATLESVLDRVFGDLPQKAELVDIPDIMPKLGQDVRVAYALPQTSLQLVFPGVKRSAPEFFAAYLMNEILGGGTFSSRLFDEVREKRGLAYGISSFLLNRVHASALVVGTATRSDRAEDTLALIREVIGKMAAEGPTEAELAAARKFVVGAFANTSLNSSRAIARTLLDMQTDNLGIDYIERREKEIDAVTLDAVRAEAAKLLDAEPTVLVVGPEWKKG